MNPNLLLKNAKIIDPTRKTASSLRDILIEKGSISKIAASIKSSKGEVWDLKGASVSIGWFDIGVQAGDPGFEHKEDLWSASAAAAFGGYTGIACYPNTNPVIHSKSEVLYVLNKGKGHLVDIYPIGAVSRDCAGKEITEMYDMYDSGAIAFSDGSHPIQSSGMMMRSLQYVKPFNGIVINQAHDEDVSKGGLMNEGKVSTSLGVKGIPSIAEELMVQRDLYLAEYTGSRLHLANISTSRAVELIRKAKSKGIKVTASANPMNLIFDDETLREFDSNYKVFPPLRRKADIKSLHKGLKDGTIDLINSNHQPQDSESKDLEFAYSEFGATNLETTFAAISTFLNKELSIENMIMLLAYRPREILGISIPEIAEGAKACLTIFDPNQKWTYTASHIRSKSVNTPFAEMEFKGKVLGVYNNRQLYKS